MAEESLKMPANFLYECKSFEVPYIHMCVLRQWDIKQICKNIVDVFKWLTGMNNKVIQHVHGAL